mmetsp:Transcript_31065/g.67223  ORF Transcript_31065/g.67223 Transcript_31065/m.67223 type:complete len:128 (-) Transcript_31065:1242-1625(-)
MIYPVPLLKQPPHYEVILARMRTSITSQASTLPYSERAKKNHGRLSRDGRSWLVDVPFGRGIVKHDHSNVDPPLFGELRVLAVRNSDGSANGSGDVPARWHRRSKRRRRNTVSATLVTAWGARARAR